MVATLRQTQARKIEEIEAALARPRFLHLAPEIIVHGAGGDRPCECCGSAHARIVERIPQPELLIDAVTGRRIYRGDVREETWARVSAEAAHYAIPIRCSVAQMPLLLETDDDRFILAASGNRAGKTQCGLNWTALQWLRRGGPGRRFWLVGPTLAKAFGMLDKLFTGDVDTPPVLPRELVITRPDTPRASSLLTVLADGSLFDLKHFGGHGAEPLKSDRIVAAQVTEAALMPAPDTLAALKGRVLDLDGRLYFDTTPTPTSFLKSQVVDAAQEFARLPDDDPKRLAGEHPGARWRVVSFALDENPWLDPAVLARELAALDPNDPAMARDWKGLWVANSGPLWREFDMARHVHVEEARTLADMPRTVTERTGQRALDITERIARKLFTARANPHYRGMKATNLRYILSSDVNKHPMSTAVLQVSADPTRPDDKDRWHVWVVDLVPTQHTNPVAHAEKLVDLTWVRTWAGSATASPYKGCGMVVDPASLGHTPTLRDPRGLAEAWGRLGFDTRAPEYKSTPNGPKAVHPLGRWDTYLLMHKLLRQGRIHISRRADPLITSFLEQLDSGNGIEPFKESHTKSDYLSSALDATRYGVWSIFHGGHEAIVGVV